MNLDRKNIVGGDLKYLKYWIVAVVPIVIVVGWTLVVVSINNSRSNAIGHARIEASNLSAAFANETHRLVEDISGVMAITLGHPVGDLLLQAVAQRLNADIRETDTVARFGGDEFALISSDIGEPGDAAVLADKVLKTLSEPYLIQGNDVRSGGSVGIAVYGLDASDAETLLSHADVALYRAKAEGRGTYRFFTDAMDMDVRNRPTQRSAI